MQRFGSGVKGFLRIWCCRVEASTGEFGFDQAVKGFEVSGVSLCKKNSSLVPFCGFGLLHVRPHLAQF